MRVISWKSIIFPSVFLKHFAIPSGLLTIAEAVKTFSSYLDGYGSLILILYFLSIVTIYVYDLISSAVHISNEFNSLSNKYITLTEIQGKLHQQFNNDAEEKKELRKQIELLYLKIQELSRVIPKNKLNETQQRIQIIEEVLKIERNEDR